IYGGVSSLMCGGDFWAGAREGAYLGIGSGIANALLPILGVVPRPEEETIISDPASPTDIIGAGRIVVGGIKTVLVGGGKLIGKGIGKVGARGVGKEITGKVNQMNKEIITRKAPKNIKRVDKGKIKGEQDHVHFKDGSALNKNGTWKHGYRYLTNQEKEWLKHHGWKLPK
ncbi:MAG: hypothetical protein AB1414_20340, partial [bacterium]